VDTPSPSATNKSGCGCLSLFLIVGCFSMITLDCLGYLDDDESEPPFFSSAADLGSVLLPSGTPLTEAQRYQWSVESVDPPWHQLQYGLSTLLVAKIEHDEEEFGRRLHFRAISPSRFSFRAPRDCYADMHCIYDELMRTNTEPVEELGTRFLTYIRAHRLSSDQAADLIIGFVQRIRYEVPSTEVPFGVIPPALVPAKNSGDCDSKALLAVMLLRQVGIDAVLLYSDQLEHAAVGVGLPGSGTEIRQGGRAWRYAEVTAVGWPIGIIPPSYDKPHLWTVVPPAASDSD
jgi:hypothetical protein